MDEDEDQGADESYLSQEDSDSVCHVCIGDEFLSAEAQDGGIETCLQCGEVRPGLTVAALAERIHPIFEQWFQVVPEDYGSPACQVIVDMAGVEENVAERIAERLSDDHGYMAVRDGGEDPYDPTLSFAEVGVPRERQEERWRRFKDSLLSEARYFNRHVHAWLDDVFRDIDGHQTWRGDPIIRSVEPGDGTAFYRARWVQGEGQLHELLSAPPSRLGPPPNGTARPGRMNAAGISVFYGALDVETCVAEIRPPVGAHVVHGRFELLRPVCLLDLDVAENIVDNSSYFDPDHNSKAERAAIVRAIGKQIAWPVFPSDEALGYLPTQVIAEYLAERSHPPIDGILYRSTQTGSEGRNVVLFNRASRVEDIDPAAQEIDVDLGWIHEEDYDDMISIRIRPKQEVHKHVPEPVAGIPELFEDPWKDFQIELPDPREATMRLDLKSIEVKRITAAIFKSNNRMVLTSVDVTPANSSTADF